MDFDSETYIKAAPLCISQRPTRGQGSPARTNETESYRLSRGVFVIFIRSPGRTSICVKGHGGSAQVFFVIRPGGNRGLLLGCSPIKARDDERCAQKMFKEALDENFQRQRIVYVYRDARKNMTDVKACSPLFTVSIFN